MQLLCSEVAALTEDDEEDLAADFPDGDLGGGAHHQCLAAAGGPLEAGLHNFFFVHERQFFEQKLSMKVRKFSYWLTRNKTP